MQASLMCCMAVLLTACDDFFGSEDNPTSAYLSMSSKPVTIKVGDTFKREATSASTAVLEYSSSNTEVATVDKNGVVTANAEGEATITATATGYSSVTGKKIYQPATVSYQLTVKHKPLTLEALSAGTILVSKPQPGMQYTKNGGAKKPVTTAAIDVVKGDKVAFFGNGTSITSYFDVNDKTYTAITGGTADVKVYGNIMSLVDEHHFDTATTLAVVAFANLFEGNTHIIDASALELPAKTLAESCYGAMFFHCTSLTAAPALPATTLADGCYQEMFNSCTSLTAAPALPATTLADACYVEMFAGCTSLTAAPALPATTLADQCYTQMFRDCISLTAAPVLPATTLADACYQEMFNCCTSLTTAPALPATTLADQCYCSMFAGCTSLTTAPEILPATTLEDACYYAMFQNCTSLIATPKLPATTLEYECYYMMFQDCHSLTKAYVKANYDATKNCATMFAECTNSDTFTFYSDYYNEWKTGDALAGGLQSQWQTAPYPTTE